jgi:hypothetical protein
LDNPFDEELQSITAPFGALLRDMIGTIDQFGLKCRHLAKHERDVLTFYRALGMHTYRSGTAEALRTKVIKYQGELFTFIRYDNVPWNNNNAENAVRRFAYYRDEARGGLKEAGLSDYLVLLSLSHTCRFKGISFLKLLLSRERDIDSFCKSPRRRQRLPAIEVNPKGVERCHFQSMKKVTRATSKQMECDGTIDNPIG